MDGDGVACGDESDGRAPGPGPGGATALLGKLSAAGTGQALEAYGWAKLFAPLGVEQFHWTAGDDGVASPASGLRLTPRDLAQPVEQGSDRRRAHRTVLRS
ncbi:hypothetical protein O7632_27980 [Solwaraspora sp. WMMD406]|uniref:hypothetical protein n=1 Tax=Solwaraspora sp. WMMD406 TaxID=3016095 RepID=UPI0024167E0A|nr:hypothetical protein [Solwaraspora sp. WMMD406]MDG4767905.1 hypothetical protein [Solwaraspora sp. WMMD406]